MPGGPAQIDKHVIGLFQRFYDVLLDHTGVRIGTFRMSIAIVPIAADFALRSFQGFFVVQLASTIAFLIILFAAFYGFRTMTAENEMQKRNDLKKINSISYQFQSATFYTRIFYLGFFGFSAVMYSDFAGIGLLSIVYARCVKVRERITPEARISLSYSPA
jgi:hypothetical protein